MTRAVKETWRQQPSLPPPHNNAHLVVRSLCLSLVTFVVYSPGVKFIFSPISLFIFIIKYIQFSELEISNYDKKKLFVVRPTEFRFDIRETFSLECRQATHKVDYKGWVMLILFISNLDSSFVC